MVKLISWLEKNKKMTVIFTVIVAIAIFAFSSIPGTSYPNFSNSGSLLSYIYHFIIFFLFAFLLIVSFNGKKDFNVRLFAFAVLAAIVYGILDEIHQMFVPFRFPGVNDVLVNNIGIFLASLIYVYKKNGRKISQ